MKPTYNFFRTINPSSGFRLILIAALAAIVAITCSPADGGGGGGGTTTVATPIITPGNTTDFEQDTPVVITCSTGSADIWYTTDGSAPSATNPTATLYAGAIPADTFAEGAGVNVTIRAIGILAGSTDSAVAQAVYTNVVDTIGPVPVMTSAFDAIGIVAAPFTLTVTFNEDVTGFDETDLALTNAAAGAAAGGPRVFTSLITPAVDDVAVTVDIAAGAANDTSAALNASQAAAQFSIMYNDDAPQGSITSTASPGPTTVSPIPISIDFGMNVVNFTISDLTVGNGTAGNFAGGPQVYTADITPTADGNVTVDIAGNVCQAQADSTPNLPSAQFSISYDGHGPFVTGVTPASGGTVGTVTTTVTVDWNEDLAAGTFTDADVTSLVNCSIANFNQVTASQYTFDLTATGEVTFSFEIAAGVCTDALGNVSTGTVNWTQTYTTAPLVGAPDLEAGSDTNTNNDNVTWDITPEFSGTCSESGTLEILSDVDGTLYTGAISGDWGPIEVTITTHSGQAGTVHNITARVTDAQSNVATSAALAVTFDTTQPNTGAPDLDAASDLGSSNSDNVTSDLTPAFSGTADEAGTLDIRSSENGSVYSGAVSGNWSGIAVSALTGSGQTGTAHGIDARVTDTAGNIGSWSGTLAITVDGTAPVVSSPDLVFTSDTNVDNDNITSDTTPDFNGTSNEDGAFILASDQDGSVYTGSVTAGAWGPFTTSALTATGQAGTAHDMTAEVTDLAGNDGTSSALTVTIDVTAPAAGTPDLDDGSDSGSSNSDNITRIQTPAFSGTCPEAATLTIRSSVDGSVYSNAVSGDWTGLAVNTLTATGQTGTAHNIDAQAMDTAGNTGAWSGALAITVDITAPTVGTPDLDTATDSGSSNSDNITSDTTPNFSGTSNEAGTLTIRSSVNGSVYSNAIAGAWSGLTVSALTGSLAGTSHSIDAQATDAAGNIGTWSGALTPVYIDTGVAWKTYADPATTSNQYVIALTGSQNSITTYTTETLGGTAAHTNSGTYPVNITDTAGNTGSRNNVRLDPAGLTTALGAVTSGYTIFITAGTYTLAGGWATTAARNCLIVGEGATTILRASNNNAPVFTVNSTGTAQWTFDSLDVGTNDATAYNGYLIDKNTNNDSIIRMRNITRSGQAGGYLARCNVQNAGVYPQTWNGSAYVNITPSTEGWNAADTWTNNRGVGGPYWP